MRIRHVTDETVVDVGPENLERPLRLATASSGSTSTTPTRAAWPCCPICSDPVTSERLLDELFALRHDLQTIRTSAAQAFQSYLLAIDERRVRDMRQGFGQLVQTVDLEREYLQEMIDLFQTRVSTELNRFVRKVTAWGTVGIAWTVITGAYGMNVVGIPGLDAPWGFAAVAGSMILVGVVLAVFFRRHGSL